MREVKWQLSLITFLHLPCFMGPSPQIPGRATLESRLKEKKRKEKRRLKSSVPSSIRPYNIGPFEDNKYILV
jgi:hypothetical protein